MNLMRNAKLMLVGGYNDANSYANELYKDGDLSIRAVTDRRERSREILPMLKKLLDDPRATTSLPNLQNRFDFEKEGLITVSDNVLAKELPGFGLLAIALADSAAHAARAMPRENVVDAATFLLSSTSFAVVSTLRPRTVAQVARHLYRNCPETERAVLVEILARITPTLGIDATNGDA